MTTLHWPFQGDDASPPPVPLRLHGHYARAEVFAAFGLLNEPKPFPGHEGLFSPTTRDNDYAISRNEFHWESESLTLTFVCLGLAAYVSHEGERPIAIRWRLKRPIPGAFVPELALAV